MNYNGAFNVATKLMSEDLNEIHTESSKKLAGMHIEWDAGY